MTEIKNNLWIAIILVISILGQVVSYVAVDRILDHVLGNPTQVIVTLSDNRAEPESEITGQIDRPTDYTGKSSYSIKEAENEAVMEDFTVLNAAAGVNFFRGHKETYYNLPMMGVVSIAKSRGIEGEYVEREDGAKCMGEYVIVAAHQGIHPYGSLVETSLGTGIVLDTGSFIYGNPEQIDIAVTW